jgi:adenine-specific DNA-methyltransferase
MENNYFLKKQLITYIGNKRKLLDFIESSILDIRAELGRKLNVFDGFAGSGCVGRLFKQYSTKVISNDLESYSYIINKTFLKNNDAIDHDELQDIIDELNSNKFTDKYGVGIIEKFYAPKNTDDIQLGERCFYTNENAKIIDNIRRSIDDYPKYKNILLSLLLLKSSVHTNTSGVFKGFYKSSKTKKGQFGGNGKNALERIMGEITLENIVLSNYNCDSEVHQSDTNELVKKLKGLDVAYYDPPYNQHPYGSNYHMLNTIVNYQEPDEISKVSGIPIDWNKSNYNKRDSAIESLNNLIKHTDSKYILLSYNNEGLITSDEIRDMLSVYGEVTLKKQNYNTFRGSRNLNNRNLKVKELLWVLKKH